MPSSIPTPVGTERSQLRGRRVAVVVYSYYPDDGRVRREAEAMAAAGMEVDIICLRGTVEKPRERLGDITIRRLPLRHRRAGWLTYLLEYGWFGFMAAVILAFRSLSRRYDVVHVHNMPDALVFCALVPKLLGAKVILDLHDPMPELFQTINECPAEGRTVKLLKILERWSIRFSDLVLTPNQAFADAFKSRGCHSDKLRIVMNSPDESIFGAQPDTLPAAGRGPGFRVMYHGTLVHRHGLDLAIRSMARLRSRITGLRFDLYGERTPYLDEMERLVVELGLQEVVFYHGTQTLEAIVEAIRGADLGVVPNRRSVFTEINLPTRIFEYLALNRPVIAPRTRGIADYFAEEDLLFFEAGDEADLAARIEWVYRFPELAHELVLRGLKRYLPHTWSVEKTGLLVAVAGLLPQ